MYKIVDFETLWMKSKSGSILSTGKRISIKNVNYMNIEVERAKRIEAELVASILTFHFASGN